VKPNFFYIVGLVIASGIVGGLDAKSCVAEELGNRGTRLAGDEGELDPCDEQAVALLKKDLAYLSADEREGRGVGTEGINQAANYIAESFEKSGLRVDSFEGKPFQTFEITVNATVGPAEQNRVVFQSNDDIEPQSIVGELGRTFRPMAVGDNKTVEAELLFVGYGITAPEFDYDDFAGLDARGRVVVVMRKEPETKEGDTRFDGPKNSKHAYFETKIRNAADHGAIGVVMVNDAGSVQAAVAAVDARITDETARLNKLTQQLTELPEDAVNSRQTLRQRRDTVSTMLEDLGRQRTVAEEGLMEVGEAGEKPWVAGLPVVSVSTGVANQLLKATARGTLDEIRKRIEETGKPSSGELNHRITLQTQLNSAAVRASNVVGVLEGKGELAEETVVVGAHYDHVGMGGYGSLAPGTIAVHNGADDNASGTSALLSSVNRIRGRLEGVSSHRRVVFIGFTGEERGLLGSEYYVRHPRFPLENTVAMINLDMVGRLRDNDLTVYGTGSAVEMDAILEAANEPLGFKLYKVPTGYGPSDHQSFYTRKVPVLFFFTGLHNDYHRPSDDFDKINFIGLTRITDITSNVAADLATRPVRPRYAATDRDVSIRWQATAYLGVQLRDMDDKEGVMITGVTPDGAAAKAEIRVGDRLRKLDETPVQSVGQVLEIIRMREANDPLKVEVKRGEEVLTVTAILQNRPG
jgi:hypothetical protein